MKNFFFTAEGAEGTQRNPITALKISAARNDSGRKTLPAGFCVSLRPLCALCALCGSGFWLRLCRAALAVFLLAAGSLANGQDAAPRSVITVHVFKAGLFSVFAHNHTIQAPIARGAFDVQGLSAEVAVAARQMKVIDPEDSDSTRAEIQSTMLGPNVLDSGKYPEIRFKSTRIEPLGPQKYRVTGRLELHGVTREIAFEVTGSPERYQGKTRINQSDFGIKPIAVAGGAVKVKDQLEIDFDVNTLEFAGSTTHPQQNP